MNEIGRRIKEIRKAKGYTQRELAKMLGKHQGQLSQWESGKVYPSLQALDLIAKALDVDVIDLLSEPSTKIVKIYRKKPSLPVYKRILNV